MPRRPFTRKPTVEHWDQSALEWSEEYIQVCETLPMKHDRRRCLRVQLLNAVKKGSEIAQEFLSTYKPRKFTRKETIEAEGIEAYRVRMQKRRDARNNSAWYLKRLRNGRIDK